MYSPDYYYHYLRAAESHTQSILRTEAVRQIQKWTQRWTDAQPEAPWVSIEPSFADDSGTFSSDPLQQYTNYIAVVGHRDKSLEIYLALLKSLGEALGWSVYLEEDEDGNEDVVLYEFVPEKLH